MWNILKATLHQTKRDRISYGMLVFMLLISFCGVFMCFMDPDTPFSGVTGSFSFIQCGMLFGSEFLALCCALIAGRIAGWDLRDQTANYEVLFGKKRSAVYFGRLLAVLLIGLISIPLILPMEHCSARSATAGAQAFRYRMRCCTQPLRFRSRSGCSAFSQHSHS